LHRAGKSEYHFLILVGKFVMTERKQATAVL